MQLQLWKSDEYGQGTIEDTSTDIEHLIKRAKEEVSKINVDNALAVDEKARSIGSVFIELVDKETGDTVEDAVYGGKTTTGHHCVVKIDDSGQIVKLDDCDVEIRFYLGNLDREDWYMKDARGLNYVTSFNEIDLVGKEIFYIRPTRQPKA